MITIAVAIQKGGSAKTTTAINLGAILRDMGKSVLLIDLDPQANLTQSMGLLDEPEPNIYHLLHREAKGEDVLLNQAIYECQGIDLIPASLELAGAEMELVSIYGREKLLQSLLKSATKNYDYILIDCPPALGMLTVNALTASDYVLMPLQAEFLPLKGVHSFMRSLEKVQKQLNPDIKVLGLLLTKYDQRKNLNRQVLEVLKRNYGSKVFDTCIRSNIALAQAQEKGIDIFKFASNSNGAMDYRSFAAEFLDRTLKK